MFMFAFLSTFLVLSRIRTVGDGPDRDSSGMHDSNIIIRNILRHPLNVESAFYVNSLQLSRRLLEYPRWIKQAYRSTDYNVVQKRHRARNKPDDGRSYRSALKDDEDEDEDEDEENENEDDEEDKISDETIGEAADETEQANADEEDEETVNEEPSEIYDYETEVRDAVSQGGGEFRKATAAKMVGGSLLIFLLT
ncbi:chaperonin CPN60, mitochondrial-like isoform X2 [Odontomachus brunneus]|uniref:chaperonin CPN60, mitochondrial-like isoform X2 n=1 Tax=Odontomachus brunneus TaxID=486640 RepID=UPI0013F27896|nr:chaperonin CPN60, mitochondrial-like isoform X2 [Odontomachus brunneus]